MDFLLEECKKETALTRWKTFDVKEKKDTPLGIEYSLNAIESIALFGLQGVRQKLNREDSEVYVNPINAFRDQKELKDLLKDVVDIHYWRIRETGKLPNPEEFSDLDYFKHSVTLIGYYFQTPQDADFSRLIDYIKTEIKRGENQKGNVDTWIEVYPPGSKIKGHVVNHQEFFRAMKDDFDFNLVERLLVEDLLKFFTPGIELNDKTYLYALPYEISGLKNLKKFVDGNEYKILQWIDIGSIQKIFKSHLEGKELPERLISPLKQKLKKNIDLLVEKCIKKNMNTKLVQYSIRKLEEMMRVKDLDSLFEKQLDAEKHLVDVSEHVWFAIQGVNENFPEQRFVMKYKKIDFGD